MPRKLKSTNTYSYDVEDGDEKYVFTIGPAKNNGIELSMRVRGEAEPFNTFRIDPDTAETIAPLIGFYIDNQRLPNYDEVTQR